MKKKAKEQAWNEFKDINVDNLLNKENRQKNYNQHFSVCFILSTYKKFKFRHFSQSSNMGCEL